MLLLVPRKIYQVYQPQRLYNGWYWFIKIFQSHIGYFNIYITELIILRILRLKL